MAEYVDREAVRDVLNNEIDQWGSQMDEKNALWFALDKLFEIPAADVVEVVHGRWINYSEHHAFAEECSVCGDYVRWDYNGELHHYKYCPNCGARMDGDTDG